MENWFGAGIAMMTLVAFFAVPTLLATLSAVIVAFSTERAEGDAETQPGRTALRLSGAVACVLAVSLLMAPMSFGVDAETNQVQSGPRREEHSLWPAVRYPTDDPARTATTSGPQREEHSLWPIVRHLESTPASETPLASR